MFFFAGSLWHHQIKNLKKYGHIWSLSLYNLYISKNSKFIDTYTWNSNIFKYLYLGFNTNSYHRNKTSISLYYYVLVKTKNMTYYGTIDLAIVKINWQFFLVWRNF